MNLHIRKKLALVLAVVGIGVMGRQAYADDPIDAVVTVSPVATVDLSLSVTTYAFGPLGVSVSSVSASSITLRNTGYVDVTVNKQILSAGDWTAADIAGSGTPGPSKFALYVATSSARPNPNGSTFVVADHLFNGMTTDTALKGIGGTSATTITTTGGALNEAYLWFRLDMPTHVTSQARRDIFLQFDGVAMP